MPVPLVLYSSIFSLKKQCDICFILSLDEISSKNKIRKVKVTIKNY